MRMTSSTSTLSLVHDANLAPAVRATGTRCAGRPREVSPRREQPVRVGEGQFVRLGDRSVD
jgi:hypothetical protein